MSRQLSCRDTYKVATQYDHYFSREGNMYFTLFGLRALKTFVKRGLCETGSRYRNVDPNLQLPALLWRHNGRDGFSNHQSHDCLLNRLFRRRSKDTPTLCVTGLCAGNQFTGVRWIPRTNGQKRGKSFHLMTSSCRESQHLWLITANCLLRLVAGPHTSYSRPVACIVTILYQR